MDTEVHKDMVEAMKLEFCLYIELGHILEQIPISFL